MLTLNRTATGYAGSINGARFTVVIKDGEQTTVGKPGHFLSAGESEQIARAVRKTDAVPLFGTQQPFEK
jgi:hypothetical protein